MLIGIKRASDRRMEARIEQFQGTARDLFRPVEEDPRDPVDTRRTRRYLTVYTNERMS